MSHWFNVFFGFYEIDVDIDKWNRPFGYKDFKSNELEFNDLFKIGKSDWNFFSNYIYGVPLEDCKKYSPIDADIETKIINHEVTIGKHKYIEAVASGVKVVTGYVSKSDNKKLLRNDGFLSLVWQTAFGRPKNSPMFTKSFIPATMKMHFYIRWEKSFDIDSDRDMYKTFIYGGTINLDYKGNVDNEAFLQAQLKAVRTSAEDMAFRKRN
jgi:hypothetical protein